MSLSVIEIFLLDYYDHRPVDEPLSEYWQSNVGEDYKERVEWLYKKGYLKIGSVEDSLPCLTVPALKDILRSKGLILSGRKDVLVQRILENIPVEDYQDKLPKIYVLTEEGKHEVDSHADELKAVKNYGGFLPEESAGTTSEPSTHNNQVNDDSDKGHRKWYDRQGIVWLMLIILWPFGMFMLYLHREKYTSKQFKYLAVGTFCIWLFFGFINPAINKPTTHPATQTAQTTAAAVNTSSGSSKDKPADTTSSTVTKEAAATSSSAAQPTSTVSSAATSNASNTTSKAASGASAIPEASYLGNPNSKKFHRPTCRTIKHPENFVAISSRDEAIADGYTPCGVCKP
ncbi:SAP domain-containing protein [Mitsuokella multacida]|uniref:SAP domain-containing protein n=1 Tax=Mitsuokella multacida TaxID=52226 RepID=UPI003F5E5E6E